MAMDNGSDLLTIVALKGVNDILWHQLDGPGKRALRLLNKAAHRETYDCVKQLTIFLADDETIASQLTLFPRLHSLCLDANSSKTPEESMRASGADLARLFLKAPVASTRIGTLALNNFGAEMRQAAAALPAMLRTSLCKLTLLRCTLCDGMLATMQCSSLTQLRLQEVEFSSPDDAASLGCFTQVSAIVHACTSQARGHVRK